MKQNILIGLLTWAILAGCTAPKKENMTETNHLLLDSLMTDYHEERLKLFPIDATLAGDNRYNDKLPNFLTIAYRKEVLDFYTDIHDRLNAIDRSTLEESDQTSFDVLEWECSMAIDGSKFHDHLMPINQLSSFHLWIGQLASGNSAQPFKTVKDYDDWLSRLASYTVWCDTAVVNMRTGIMKGYTIPRALVSKIIPQFTSLDHGPVKDHLFYMPIKSMPDDFPAADKERLTNAYTEMIQTKVIPAHKRISDFLQNEYLPACRTSSGIEGVPDGADYYSYLTRYYTTTSLSADEIFTLGQSEVQRISQEMEMVKEQVGFKGDLKSFFAHLRTLKELKPFSEPEEVLAHFNAIHERMKPQLMNLFEGTPKTPFEIRRTEAFRETSASAEYVQGSVDGTRPGIFYVPIPNAKEYYVLSNEDLFLHEAIPGHHYQISLQQENTSLPAFRRMLIYSSYAEGWALYTESLGKELGLYTDPYQYFGMLSAEMHRAIRLVVDAGMHTQGWTREQAIQYSLDNEAESEESIIAEIERYMAIPGQALSYKIGQLKIRELRSKAEKELGDKFNIAQFHQQVLEPGCLPLTVLEKKVNGWIEKTRDKQ